MCLFHIFLQSGAENVQVKIILFHITLKFSIAQSFVSVLFSYSCCIQFTINVICHHCHNPPIVPSIAINVVLFVMEVSLGNSVFCNTELSSHSPNVNNLPCLDSYFSTIAQ